MKSKVIIADDEPIIRMDISEMLTDYGYSVIGEARDGFEAVELCRKLLPDLVLMDIKMPMLDGLKAAEIITKEKTAKSIVMLTAYSDRRMVALANKAEVMGYVTKPVDANALIPAIEVALHAMKKIQSIESELDKAKQVLEARKLIDKAKSILMSKQRMTESDAYHYLRKEAMDRSCTMGRIAEIIIISNQSPTAE